MIASKPSKQAENKAPVSYSCYVRAWVWSIGDFIRLSCLVI